jgi:hypothetical protein
MDMPSDVEVREAAEDVTAATTDLQNALLRYKESGERWNRLVLRMVLPLSDATS